MRHQQSILKFLLRCSIAAGIVIGLTTGFELLLERTDSEPDKNTQLGSTGALVFLLFLLLISYRLIIFPVVYDLPVLVLAVRFSSSFQTLLSNSIPGEPNTLGRADCVGLLLHRDFDLLNDGTYGFSMRTVVEPTQPLAFVRPVS
ncbi:hypothetical protein MTO96_044156 [Rhipicephalus appendiculatus]